MTRNRLACVAGCVTLLALAGVVGAVPVPIGNPGHGGVADSAPHPFFFCETYESPHELPLLSFEFAAGSYAGNRSVEFSIFRPGPAAGQYQCVYTTPAIPAAPNTTGNTYAVPAGDRIMVQPGDTLGIYAQNDDSYGSAGGVVPFLSNLGDQVRYSNGIHPAVGTTITPTSLSQYPRTYDAVFNLDQQWVGSPVIPRPNTDGGSAYTMLNVGDPVLAAGKLSSFEYYINTNEVPEDRQISLVVIRPGTTLWTVIAQSGFHDVPVLPGTGGVCSHALGEYIEVLPDDLIGFYYRNGGTVAFEPDPGYGQGAAKPEWTYTSLGDPVVGSTFDPATKVRWVQAPTDSNGWRIYSFRASFVPEPATALLLLGGVAALVRRRRR